MTTVMLPAIGDQPTANDYDVVIDGPYARKGIRAFHIAPADLEHARAFLLERLPAKGAAMFDPLATTSGPLMELGCFVAHVFGVNEPRAALAHRDVPLPYHVDTQSPYMCLNILVILAFGGIGADLVFPDERVAVRTVDGLAVLFDGMNRLHGLTLFELAAPGSYRIGLTYYCPI